MNIAAIDQIAYEKMSSATDRDNCEPGCLYYHGRRTGNIALELAKQARLNVEEDIMYIGALFHDVARGTEPHNEVGAQLVEKLLRKHCSRDELQKISNIVSLHDQLDGVDLPVEVKLVQDANLLDHVGLMWLWRSFYWCGRTSGTFDNLSESIGYIKGGYYRAEMRGFLNFKQSIREFKRRANIQDEFVTEFRRTYLAED
jgi:uncharacterized protein